MKMSPMQVCHEGSNWAADGDTRFNCLSMAKNLKVRHTCKARSRAPMLGVMVQMRWSSRGRMGRCHRGGVRMKMSAARSKQDTWKDSRASGVRPISLWRVLTLET